MTGLMRFRYVNKLRLRLGYSIQEGNKGKISGPLTPSRFKPLTEFLVYRSVPYRSSSRTRQKSRVVSSSYPFEN